MPLRTKLYTHIFADNEHWSWQKFAVKRDKSVQFMKKKEKVRQPPGLGLLSLGISIQWPIMYQVYAMIRLGDVSHCVGGVRDCVFSCSCFWPGRLESLPQHALPPYCSWTACAAETQTLMTCCLIIQPERTSRINRYALHNVDMCPVCHSCLDRGGILISYHALFLCPV